MGGVPGVSPPPECPSVQLTVLTGAARTPVHFSNPSGTLRDSGRCSIDAPPRGETTVIHTLHSHDRLHNCRPVLEPFARDVLTFTKSPSRDLLFSFTFAAARGTSV